MRRKIAYNLIKKDETLNISEEQKKEVYAELKKVESDLKTDIQRLYRTIAIPDREGFKKISLGVPTYGDKRDLNQRVYEMLCSEGEILEAISPLFIKEKYLSKREYVYTENLYQSSLKTPGEKRFMSGEAIKKGIAEGVSTGLFGLGEIESGSDKPICRYFKKTPSIALSDNEVIIDEALCEEEGGGEGPTDKDPTDKDYSMPLDKIKLKFQVPFGRISNIMGIMNLLQSKFDTLEIELIAKGGEISEQDYKDKIEEALRQLGIEPIEE